MFYYLAQTGCTIVSIIYWTLIPKIIYKYQHILYLFHFDLSLYIFHSYNKIMVPNFAPNKPFLRHVGQPGICSNMPYSLNLLLPICDQLQILQSIIPFYIIFIFIHWYKLIVSILSPYYIIVYCENTWFNFLS